jgi:Fe2+ transport system protein FeoA
VGLQVTVMCIDCPALDAARLRTLGVYEGARVGVVDTRSGMLLDVRGARLALGWNVVLGIRVMPALP